MESVIVFMTIGNSINNSYTFEFYQTKFRILALVYLYFISTIISGIFQLYAYKYLISDQWFLNIFLRVYVKLFISTILLRFEIH